GAAAGGGGGCGLLVRGGPRPHSRSRRYSRVFVIPVTRPVARAVPWTDGGTLETYLLDRGVRSWPAPAEIRVYETLPGAELGHLAQGEAGGGPPRRGGGGGPGIQPPPPRGAGPPAPPPPPPRPAGAPGSPGPHGGRAPPRLSPRPHPAAPPQGARRSTTGRFPGGATCMCARSPGPPGCTRGCAGRDAGSASP